MQNKFINVDTRNSKRQQTFERGEWLECHSDMEIKFIHKIFKESVHRLRNICRDKIFAIGFKHQNYHEC